MNAWRTPASAGSRSPRHWCTASCPSRPNAAVASSTMPPGAAPSAVPLPGVCASRRHRIRQATARARRGIRRESEYVFTTRTGREPWGATAAVVRQARQLDICGRSGSVVGATVAVSRCSTTAAEADVVDVPLISTARVDRTVGRAEGTEDEAKSHDRGECRHWLRSQVVMHGTHRECAPDAHANVRPPPRRGDETVFLNHGAPIRRRLRQCREPRSRAKRAPTEPADDPHSKSPIATTVRLDGRQA